MSERKFNCSGKGRSFLISTQRHSDIFFFEFESSLLRGNVEVDIYHFDRLVKQVTLEACKDQKVSVENLVPKKIKHLYVYQFHLKVKSGITESAPLFVLQLYPGRKN